MRITPEKTIYQLAFLPRTFPVNCYLVEEDDSVTLIDAALPFSWRGIMKATTLVGKPIKRILLTHAHEDHVGALNALKQTLPEVPIYISEREAPLLAGDCTLFPDEPDTPIRGGVPKKLNIRADILLKDGDRIGSLLAVSAPGHTPGSMAYLDTRNNILIAGDAFQTRGGTAVSGQLKPWFPFPAMATWHKHTALESARKLKDYHPTLLAVGHGRMLKNPDAAIRQAITEAEFQLGSHL